MSKGTITHTTKEHLAKNLTNFINHYANPTPLIEWEMVAEGIKHYFEDYDVGFLVRGEGVSTGRRVEAP